MTRFSWLHFAGFLLILSTLWFPPVVDAHHGTPLTMPDNTWVTRMIPNRPESLMGVHQSLGRGGAKHVNFEMSNVDHLLYVQGGDAGSYVLSNGKAPVNSNRQEVYTYDVKHDRWTQVHPFCAPPGAVAPMMPDFGPWIWDSTRTRFWYFGGGNQCEGSTCNLVWMRDTLCGSISDATTVYTDRKNHWYNITTNRYETPSVNGHDTTNIQEILGRTASNILTDGIYDSVKDDFWMPVACNWLCIYRYDPTTDTDSSSISSSGWTKFEWKNKSFQFAKSRVTWDPTRRNIYVVSSSNGSDLTGDHLLKFNIDTQVFTDLGKLPGPVPDLVDQNIIYNSVEDVLMFPQFDQASWAKVQLYVYHLGGTFAGHWEGIDMTIDHEIAEVHGRHWVYDPYNNVLLGTGGSDDYQPRLYLYRYKKPSQLHPFNTVLPGHWYRVVNSKAIEKRPTITNAAVDPNGGCVGNSSHPHGACGFGGPIAVTDAWGGGGLDYRRSHYYLWGGGHGDYAGNEVYKLDLNLIDGKQVANPWVLDRDMDVPYHAQFTVLPDVSGEVRLKPCAGGPSGPFIATNCFPGSVHSYDQIEYIGRDFDYICSFMNAAARNGARKNIHSFCYDPQLKQWHQLPDNVPGAMGAQSITGYDRFHHRLLYKASETGFWLAQFEPRYQLYGSNAWKGISKGGSAPTDFSLFPGYTGVMVQWEQQGNDEFIRFVAIGRKSSVSGTFPYGDPDVIYYDLGFVNGKELPTEVTPTGDLSIFSLSKNVGADFDATTHQIVMWNGGCDVYVMNPKTFVIERRPPAEENVECPSAAPQAGVFNRWRYLPRWNGYLVANRMNEDVWFYRLTPTASSGHTPTPDLVPPGPPTQITVN